MAACIDAVRGARSSPTRAGGAELPGVIHLDVPEARGEIHVKAGHLHGAPVLRGEGGERVLRPGAARDRRARARLRRARRRRRSRSCSTAGTSPTCAPAPPAASRPADLAPERVERVAVIGTGIAGAPAGRGARASCGRASTRSRVWGRDPAHARRAADDIDGAARDGRVADRLGARGRRRRRRRHHLHRLARAARRRRPGSRRRARDRRGLRRRGQAGARSRRSLRARRRAGRRLARSVLAARRAAARARPGRRAPWSSARLRGRAPGRTGEEQLTVCDLTGVGVQDVAAANAVMAGAAERRRDDRALDARGSARERRRTSSCSSAVRRDARCRR